MRFTFLNCSKKHTGEGPGAAPGGVQSQGSPGESVVTKGGVPRFLDLPERGLGAGVSGGLNNDGAAKSVRADEEGGQNAAQPPIINRELFSRQKALQQRSGGGLEPRVQPFET